MVESHWVELRGQELRYADDTWELTGDVDVLESGELLGVEARQADDVRHGTATLYFGLDSPTESLNQGALGEHFDRLERTRNGHHLVVKKEARTYRYELQRIEPE
jgi:hypothetical protein